VPEVQGHFAMPQASVAPDSMDEETFPATVRIERKRNPSADGGDELMQAFLRGAGLSSDVIASGVSKEFMETLGKLLAVAMQGTVELIASRALVKRELRADMTLIAAGKNNPLKFLPDGQTVLLQMLRERMPGFMAPVEAMQDAYEDLRAHQIGVVAGMRAAMSDLLERFDPRGLEAKAKGSPLLQFVLPASRKASMWDRYTELFESIALAARDDLETLFGKTFVAAYEAETERFRKGMRDE
jgi:FHA domain-containing protein